MVDEHQSRFLRWLRDHVGVMLKVVRAYAATPHDQEDLFQNVLLNLWSSLPNFRGDSQEITWIYRVSINTALVWKRDESRRQRHRAESLRHAVAANVLSRADDSPSRNELIEQLYAAIRQLAKVDASLALMHLDGLSYQEMSEVLGITENHVGVKLTRIRRQLAAFLPGVPDEF